MSIVVGLRMPLMVRFEWTSPRKDEIRVILVVVAADVATTIVIIVIGCRRLMRG